MGNLTRDPMRNNAGKRWRAEASGRERLLSSGLGIIEAASGLRRTVLLPAHLLSLPSRPYPDTAFFPAHILLVAVNKHVCTRGSLRRTTCDAYA